MLVGENGLPIIGVYPLTNVGTITIHTIQDDAVLASLNGGEAEWFPVVSKWIDCDENYMEEKLVYGFNWDKMFVSFEEIMRCC